MATKGIDVSYWNVIKDWSKVKASGIEFCYVRAGKRFAVEEQFAANIKGARAAGIAVGVYWFSYALNVAEAVKEAEACLAAVSAYKLDLPIYYDYEYNSDDYAVKQGVTPTITSRTAIIKAFCDRIAKAGYAVGIYTNLDYIKYKLNYTTLKGFPLWLALHVNNNTTSFASVSANAVIKSHDVAVWQIGKGTVPGITGNVDLNYGYTSIPAVAVPAAPTAPNKPDISSGDKVRVINTTTSGGKKYGKLYSGSKFTVYYDVYDVMQPPAGDRVVIGIGKTVTASVNSADLQRV